MEGARRRDEELTLSPRLDKKLFSRGLAKVQSRIEKRFYVTALSFAQDLGDIIGEGIATAPRVEVSDQRFEAADAAPPKNAFSDIRERRKLGKRILKALQPYLETALRVESEISKKPYEKLQKELEAVVDASIDAARASSAGGEAKRDDAEEEDTIMVDAPDASEIMVKSAFRAEAAMDTGEDGGNIEVKTSGLGIVGADALDAMEVSPRRSKRSAASNGVDASETPPAGHEFRPPTPPQSNGSLSKEPGDALAEGGILWYLKAMKPVGTSILSEHWAAGRDAVRMLSEDLTDLDDEELRGLGADVDEAVAAAGMDAEPTADNKVWSASKSKTSSRARRRRASGRRR